jgi:REP element-mobilizing transposase RayT
VNIFIAAEAAPTGGVNFKEFLMKKVDCHPSSGNRALRYGRHSEPHLPYLITTVTWKRQPFFADLFVGRIVVEEMRHVQDEGLAQSMAWVLMPNHLHWMVQLTEKGDLARVMFFVKGRSAHDINKRLNRKGPVWRKAFYDHALRKDEDVKKMARYIITNPLRKGLVDTVGDYPLWDAIWV